jgi:tRNA pseudouridine38-40 synthase
VYFPEEAPDVEKMKKASQKLLGTHDFHGFSSVGKTKKSTVRTVNSVEIAENDGVITISINGDGFLYNMVRILVGTLYEIGIGKKDANVIDEIFSTCIREKAGITMPAEGLCLKEVFY